ncbi:hypothetical protein EYM_07165 [Ignicoccus islandicus DSM 13165]|uniref:Uncharacterized protein n=1 Tax=Ignicoccus islandicus DSM 13165 TaxID=940295 RepID=A0A0U3EE72_9CREN|nr:hypothetical protein [Ignicoccus islandicus]ALU12755.1 hypothetical protein EYM_07165 [Ignicoccus islandicus DSM 13165]
MKVAILILLLSVIVFPCIDVQVDVQAFRNYSLVKVSYESSCIGEYEISFETSSHVYSYSGNVVVLGSRYVAKGTGFPGFASGFSLKLVGPLKGTVEAKFNGLPIAKYAIGIGNCIVAGVSRSTFFALQGEVTVTSINLFNYCRKQVRVDVEVEGGEPLREVSWIFCSKGKGEVSYHNVCVEEKCVEWEVIGEVCSKKVKTCKLTPEAGVSCEEECIEKAPVYQCIKKECNVSYLLPTETRECIEYSGTSRGSDFEVRGNKMVAEVSLEPGKGKSLIGYLKGTPILKVNVNGEEIKLIASRNVQSLYIYPEFAFFVAVSLLLALLSLVVL